MARSTTTGPQDVVDHLDPQRWAAANRTLVRKAFAEFAHERLLVPEPDGDRWAVHSDDGLVTYRFAADRLALDHWHVDAESITRHRAGIALPLDALDLFLELRDTLGLTEEVLPEYLEEITSTMAGIAFKLADPTPSKELARADFQTIESGMTEGHPCFVADNGRLGLDAAEYRAYAPEAGAPVRLVWLAVRRDRATFACSDGVDHDLLVRTELDAATLARLSAVLLDLGLDLDAYYLLPVHPWQWWNRIAVTFAADLARRDVVCLGEGDDVHLAQHSARTFLNSTAPQRHYVKTALSVLDLGFLRGLPGDRRQGTPAINDWLAELIAGDEVLTRHRFTLLRERAAIGYHAAQYAAAAPNGSPHIRMLTALWRESPRPEPGERLATMASLLHVDHAGDPLVVELIAESGLEPAAWLSRYLQAYLTPLLHCLYAHRLVFVPHGANLILVLRDGAPTRVMMNDIGEQIAVLDAEVELPSAVERIRVQVPDELVCLPIHTDVFDRVFRFLAAILHTNGLLPQDEFWAAVAACVADYQRSAPQLADRFARHDLFAERFALSGLNRVQLRDGRQTIDLADPTDSRTPDAALDNPIARHRP